MLPEVRQFLETLLLAVGALLPIVNPLGGAPIYLAKTGDLSVDEHRDMSRRVAINCFMLLLVSTFIGAYVLDFFGLSIPAVQVAGGAVVCAIGWNLLNEPDAMPRTANDAVRATTSTDLARRAFYPLTMPLTVGPGSISVAITLGANHAHGVERVLIGLAAGIIGTALISLSVWLAYAYAERVALWLGHTRLMVLLRLSAFIVLCIGVQITWNGIKALASEMSFAPPTASTPDKGDAAAPAKPP